MLKTVVSILTSQFDTGIWMMECPTIGNTHDAEPHPEVLALMESRGSMQVFIFNSSLSKSVLEDRALHNAAREKVWLEMIEKARKRPS
jgi:hypothetical protein